jgi:hypothetical protein
MGQPSNSEECNQADTYLSKTGTIALPIKEKIKEL